MKLAFLFPGQGSQAVGMLAAHDDPVVAATLAEAADVLGWDLPGLIAQGPEAELNRTERTQPALLAADIALWRLWQSRGLPQATVLAGHSLGEYAALVAAGSLDFADALRLVELRGQLMQAAVPEGRGGMAAVIGLDDAQVDALCAAYPGDAVLEAANYNSPGQVVLAGEAEAIAWVLDNAKAQGARMAVKLPMSVPSHCSLMHEAAQTLFERLNAIEVRMPVVPVLHNLDGRPRNTAQGIREALRDQLHRPVRWVATVEAMTDSGHANFVECGPGKVLGGLNKRIRKELQTLALETPAGLAEAAGLA